MLIIQEVVVSLVSFLVSLSLPGLILLFISKSITEFFIKYSFSLAVSYVLTIFGCVILKRKLLQVAIRASFLGIVFFVGLYLAVLNRSPWNIFGWYLCVLSFFHWSEYFCIAISNPKSIALSSFMLNHSVAYALAAVSSWTEFTIEQYFFPFLKQYTYISIIGFVICIGGEFLRKLAMLTASSNFNHIVQTEKDQDHELITRGVYSVFRHPSYVGWFYWSIGTQLILVNPICVVIYTLASWSFFKSRLIVEEEALISFFGPEYLNYKDKVPSGLPFNEGVRLHRIYNTK